MGCRFLGDAGAMQKPVQVTAGGQRLPAVHTRACDPATQHRLPSGYLGFAADSSYDSDELRRARLRSCWTDDVEVAWDEANELKWTADEMLFRAVRAEQLGLEEEHKLPTPLADLPPEERKAAFKRLQRRLKKIWLLHGVRGLPVFYKLSYFRCDCVHGHLADECG